MQDLLGGCVDHSCQQPNEVIGFVQKKEVKGSPLLRVLLSPLGALPAFANC